VEKRIIDVLYGRVALDTESAAIQSACQLPIYEGAVELLNIKDKEDRLKALKKIPELIRPHVKAEALRIWAIRKANNEVLSDAEHTD
jgi:hypothetical protein